MLRQVGAGSKGFAPATVANAGSPGSASISRKTTAQGRPVVTACTCGERAFRAIFCAGAPGACGHPVFPAPSDCRRVNDQAKLGRIRAARLRRRVVACAAWGARAICGCGDGKKRPAGTISDAKQTSVSNCGSGAVVRHQPPGQSSRSFATLLPIFPALWTSPMRPAPTSPR